MSLHKFFNTGIVTDERYLRHNTGDFHPESSRRLVSLYEMLLSEEMAGRFDRIEPRSASYEELSSIHLPSYIDRVASTAGNKPTYLDPDTIASADSFEASIFAAGGLINAVDAVMAARVRNAFAFVRPPGHHAQSDRSGGFCIFNNIAIAAAYARTTYRLGRILIVDWDLHHGNGTQNTFYKDPGILYFSTHQYPLYPGSGSIEEIGIEEGTGYTVNVPLSKGQGDAEYLSVFRRILEPVACEYKPQLILLSAGFDICAKDLLGGMKVTSRGFTALTRVLLDIAEKCCQGRLVATLEGGYNVDIMTHSIKAVLMEMSGMTITSPCSLDTIQQSAGPSVQKVIDKIIKRIQPYWKVF
ncbi:MAG: histone deacetylase [Syntrophales bacterium]|jgi:acetoin utilization deacetylase AcuC-like enzyme|nr:histone deacetylase [Syntrophales bacterium]MDY0045324.1 histone deacetylase [Syntrophales bacterium]